MENSVHIPVDAALAALDEARFNRAHATILLHPVPNPSLENGTPYYMGKSKEDVWRPLYLGEYQAFMMNSGRLGGTHEFPVIVLKPEDFPADKNAQRARLQEIIEHHLLAKNGHSGYLH